MSEPVLYVGDRIVLNRGFAEMVLTMLPPGYEEVLEVKGAVTQSDGAKILLVNTIEKRVIPPTEAP